MGTGEGVLSRATQRTRAKHCVVSGSNGVLNQEYCLGVAVLREVSSGEVVSYWHNGTMLGATRGFATWRTSPEPRRSLSCRPTKTHRPARRG